MKCYNCISIMRSKLILLLSITWLSGCFSPPEFSDVPRISLNRLSLTDDAQLILSFNVKDGDGNIGLLNRSEKGELVAEGIFVEDGRDEVVYYELVGGTLESDLLYPFQIYSFIIDSDDNVVTKNSTGHNGPFYTLPVIQTEIYYSLLYFDNASKSQSVRYESSTEHIYAGGKEFFSDVDERPVDYDCNEYEIVPRNRIVTNSFQVDGQQGTFYDQTIQSVEYDTAFVVRNPFFYNIYVEIEVKDGGNYIPVRDFYDVIEPCDPIYTGRFPVFERANFGRPVDGVIDYTLSSGQFLDGPILQETIRFKFFIYDQSFNKSNEVVTPDFRILDLRQKDLVPN